MPIKPGWKISALWMVLTFSGCYGPDIGAPVPRKDSTEKIPAPQVLLPVSGYRTSSHQIRFQSDDNPEVESTEIEVYQDTSLIYSGTTTRGINFVTMPGAPTGNFTLRACNKKNDATSAYSDPVAFTVEDYAAATPIYHKDYSTVTQGCGSSSGFPSVWSVFCSSDPARVSMCSDAIGGGGGNVWICNSTDTMGANNSGSDLYSANNAIFVDYNAPDGSLTATGYLQNASGTDDGLGLSCRDHNDGNNNHYAAWFYPNRNPATNDNLVLVRHYTDNTNITLASGRFAELQNKGAGEANAFKMRLDCLGSHITVYYETAGIMKPMLSVSDTSLTHSSLHSYFGFGVGPGGITSRHARMKVLTIKRYP